MDDWKKRIEDRQQLLAEWQKGFDERYAALARKKRGWFGKLSEPELDEVAEQARRESGEEVTVELFAFLRELCDAYLAEPLPAPRAKFRAWIGADPTTLNATWSFAVQSLELLRGPEAEANYRRGLAALSIVDLRVDFNEMQELLGRYWVEGRKAGLDPKAHFAAVAALSNPGMGGGGTHMAQTLRDFDATSYFRDRVRPLLPRHAV
jgi:hypothetical protein